MVLSLKKIKRKNKRAALELSIGTIVILVLAMSMLILGLILVRTIFSGATDNVSTMNEKVRQEINDLFVEGQKGVLKLAEGNAKIKQGDPFGVAFGIINTGKTQKFRWSTIVEDDNIRKKCGIADREAEAWIATGGTGSVELKSGDTYADRVLFNILEGSVSDISTCIIRFKIVIKDEEGVSYVQLPFTVDVN
jgi:hypothetical protein